MRKKLIEVALPLEAINEASAREKSIRHGHPSTLHLWWARRPLAACRAVIFASLVDDPDDPDAPPEFVEACRELPKGKNAAENDTPRQRLFDFIEVLVQWESTTDEDVLNTARHLIHLATNGNPPPLLDPFAGGGSIPLEAQRLGLEAHASDLNPVAVMINKALIEIPPKFANMPPVNPRDRELMGSDTGWRGAAGLAADVRYYGEWMRDKAWERIGHLYPDCNGERVIAWLWARTVQSPNPAVNTDVPLVSSFWLSKKKGKEAWVEPVVDAEAGTYHFEVRYGQPSDPDAVTRGTKFGRAAFECLLSKVPIQADYIDELANEGLMGAAPLAIVTEGNRGRSYYAFNNEQLTIVLEDAKRYLDEEVSPDKLPTQPARGTFASNAQGRIYGFKTFADYFTSRQLVALTTFSDLVSEARQQIYADALESGLPDDDTPLCDGGTGALALAEAVAAYLSIGLNRVAMGCNSLARWNSVGQKVQHCFGRQALPMVWDYADPNPFAESTGSWASGYKYVADPLEMGGVSSGTPAFAVQKDARSEHQYDAVVISTDPPYYDNVDYADLSDFFYVWLRPNLREVYPEIFATLLTPKSLELIASPYRFDGNKEAANEHFESGLFETFTNLRASLSDEYPLTAYYAFKQSEIVDNNSITNTGWETMLEGLIASELLIRGTWPIRTEMRTRMVASGANALASSIVLVCRPRPDDAPVTSRREFVAALRAELPAALREMQSGNIAPVDLAQASIGPGMAVYSRYSKVLEPDGSRLTVRTALQIINQVLDEYLAEQESYVDEDTRFALAWFEQFGFNSGDFGTADVLARAKNTSVDGMVYAGVVESGAGKVRLLHWSELDPSWDPSTDKRLTVWEATHYLIERLSTHGEEGAAMLLARMPADLATEARQLAYHLYQICDRKGWAEHARDYNALVVSWSASQEQAVEFRDQYQQGWLFE